ncbi:FAD:protein FMN transferase [Roseomonas sp. F4]
MDRLLLPPLLRAPAPPRGGVLRNLRGTTMGTSWSVRLVDHGGPSPAPDIQLVLDRIVAEMSAWVPESALSRFNQAPTPGWHPLPSGLRSVLGCAMQVAAASDGAFDPTIAPLVDLWGFGPNPVPPGLPSELGLMAARARCGWRHLMMDARGLWQPGGLRLDVCGIAKGFAVDQVAAHLRAAGHDAFLVEIGGELRGEGVKPDGTPWWVEIESPPGLRRSAPFRVALHDISVATSGDYRRFFDLAGRRYTHTIDPRSGWPAGAELASVTVLHESCMRADAEATALGVLGLAAGMAHARRHGLAALFLARRGDGLREHLSPALAAMRA